MSDNSDPYQDEYEPYNNPASNNPSRPGAGGGGGHPSSAGGSGGGGGGVVVPALRGDLVAGESGLARKRKIQRACKSSFILLSPWILMVRAKGRRREEGKGTSPNRARLGSFLPHHRQHLQLYPLTRRENLRLGHRSRAGYRCCSLCSRAAPVVSYKFKVQLAWRRRQEGEGGGGQQSGYGCCDGRI